MIVEMWALNIKLDLYDKTNIKQTLQVNDIADLKDRQASYTNSFNIPKTANNRRAFDALGIASDTSRTPYTKPNCVMKLEGFDFLTSGWLNIQETASDYKVYIYSGIINFFKAIENKTLGDLDLSEIEHTKNVQSVVDSFSNNAYKYLITDYNGLTHYGTNGEIINIDHLIPSVNVKYLWDKIHSTFLFTYSGPVFTSEPFVNLWLMYPKALNQQSSSTVLTTLQANKYACAWDNEGNNKSTTGYLLYDASNYKANNDFELIKYPYKSMYGYTFDNYGYFKAKKKGFYKFDASLILKGLSIHANARIAFCFNAPNTTSNDAYNNYKEHTFDLTFKDGNPSTATLEGSSSFLRYMEADETFCIVIYFYDDKYTYQWTFFHDSDSSLKITRIDEQQTAFSEELKGMTITDFVKEIFNMFCLTAFPSEFAPDHMKYLSFKDRIETATILDWSSKYIERTSETYKIDGYAQKNYFRYQYNDKEESYHDGSLTISNVNLSEKTTLFSSKTYSPERNLSEFFVGSAGLRFLKVFKLYDKNVKEDANGNTISIEYKGLDKRFHFAKAERITSTATIGSQTLQESQVVNDFYLATFNSLDWNTLLNKNYKELGRIINDSRIHQIDVDLNLTDFLDFDFNSIIYFEQEQQYYIPNKLEIAHDSKQVSGEFIRFKKEKEDSVIINPPDGDTEINITWGDNTVLIKTGVATTEILKVSSLLYPVDDELIAFEWERFDGTNWIGLGTGVTPYTVSLIPGLQKFRLKGVSINGNIFYSNELQYTRLAYNCTNYYIYVFGDSGTTLDVYYQDCNGEWQTWSDYNVGPPQYISVNICAVENSVSTSNGTIEAQGQC